RGHRGLYPGDASLREPGGVGAASHGRLAALPGVDRHRNAALGAFPTDACLRVRITQCAEKGDHLSDFLLAQSRRLTGLTVQRRIRGVDIPTPGAGDIVKLHQPVLECWIPVSRIGVTLDVEVHDILQCGESAIVEEESAARHIAQSRGSEISAVLPLVFQVCALRAAHAQVEESRVAVGGYGGIARDAERVITVVGKERRPATGPGGCSVTGDAISLV